MLVDLVDSTKLSERLDGEDYLELIQSYQNRVNNIVNDWGGHIAQYLGDGVLVYFGYPVAGEDDADRAVHAGIGVLRAAERLSMTFLRNYGVNMQVRVGIHTGNVVAADIGEGEKTDRLALGPTPNVAARVQAQAAPGQVFISETVYHALRGNISIQSVGQQELKGVSQPLELFHVLSDEYVESTDAAPLIGRESELSRVVGLMAGANPSVAIIGEAGIGKTRLVKELSKRVDRRCVVVRGSAFHSNEDLYPYGELLKHLAKISDKDAKLHQRRSLQNWLDEIGVETTELAHIEELLGLRERTEVTNRKAAFEALVLCLGGLAKQESVCLVLEDAHWADPSSLELTSMLIDAGSIAVLITTRPSSAPLPKVEMHAELSNLVDAHVQELIEGLHAKAFPKPILSKLIERSEGVPFYVKELTRVVSEKLTSGAVGDLEVDEVVPDSLESALNARLDSLGDAKEVAQIGALLGREFPPDLLRAVYDSDADLNRLLATLLDSELVSRVIDGDQTRFRFRHALVQDIAYSSLLRRRQKTLHDRVANVMETDFPEVLREEPQIVARHLEGTERYRDAMQAYRMAGQRAKLRSAFDEAAAAYRQALAMLELATDLENRDDEESRLLRNLVSTLTARGGYGAEDTRPYLDRISVLNSDIKDPVARFGALISEWGFHAMLGHKVETRHFSEGLKPFCDQSFPPIVAASAGYAVGSTYLYAGEFSAATDYLNMSIKVLDTDDFGTERKHIDSPAFLAFLVRGFQLCLLGQYVEALKLLDKALALADRVDSPLGITQTLIHRDFVHRELEWDVPTRTTNLQRAMDLSEQHGLDQWHLASRRMQEWARLEAGEVALLPECLDHYVPEHENTSVMLAYEISRSAQTLIALDEVQAAALIMQRARTFADERLGGFSLADVLRIEAILALMDGDRRLAKQLFAQGVAIASERRTVAQELRLYLDVQRYVPEEFAKYADCQEDCLASVEAGAEGPFLDRARASLLG